MLKRHKEPSVLVAKFPETAAAENPTSAKVNVNDMMHRYPAILVLALSSFVLSPLAVGQNRVQTGSLSGTVRSTSGAPVGGIQVAAVRVFPIEGVAAPPIVYSATDPAGYYEFKNLAVASYKLCVLVQGIPLLDPCLWSDNPPLSNLRAGKSATLNLDIEEGAWLHVRIEDADGSLAQQEQARGKAAISVRVRTNPGFTENLRQISSDSKGRSFRIAVPRGKDLDLVLTGDGLDVEDRDGKHVGDGGQAGKVRVESGSRVLEFKAKALGGGNAK